MNKKERVIAEAKKWVGYLEKKSNASLDSYTANAGSANYTRFNRDYVSATGDRSAQPEQWCGIFVSMCFAYALGVSEAKALLGGLFKYTPSGAAAFKKMGRYIPRGKGTPQAGDVVFFYSKSKGRIGHTGLVWKVSGGRVYTIEGNTSGGSGLVTNGGCVAKKSYALTSTYIDGYGRPEYREENDTARLLQLSLIARGISCGPCGADGEIGPDTKKAIGAFQRLNGLQETGEADEKTLRLLLPKLTVSGDCWIRAVPYGKQLAVAKKGTVLQGNGLMEDGWNGVLHEGICAWVSAKYTKEEK